MKQITKISLCLLLFVKTVNLYAQNVGIGTTSPQHKLDINGDMHVSSAIYLQQPSGLTSKYIGPYAGSNNFGFFGTSGSFGFYMNTQTGNTGIGISNPETRLDVSGPIKLRHNGNTAGLWLEGTNNTLRSFIGVVNDSTVGFWGNAGAGWNFTHNLNSGYTGIGLGTSVPPAAELDVNGTLRFRMANAKKGSIIASADQQGKLKWDNTVAFRAEGLLNGTDAQIQSTQFTKLLFDNTPSFNYGAAFNGATSDFIVPETGIYQLVAQYTPSASEDFGYQLIRMMKVTAGDTTVLASLIHSIVMATEGYFLDNANSQQISSGHVKLFTGDKIFVQVQLFEYWTGGPLSTVIGLPNYTWFSGELISRL